jgi:predicted ATPase
MSGAPHANEICCIELAPLTDGALVPHVLASALGVPEQSDRPALEVLADALSMRRILIVLDNCEHLVESCAALADGVLRNCPDVRILTTSRQPLGVGGETIWRVPPLTEAEALQIFVDRAQAVQPGWALTERSAPAVRHVCQRLDGIPLAIEFAAARVSVLAAEQIAARLGDRLVLLTTGNRTAPPRQQTLRATLDWSYGLLTPDERLVFDRLSVFAGGWSLEAAEVVCAGGRIQPANVLDLLTRLVDQSLVVADYAEDGPVRYRLLETLREYADQQLTQSRAADQVRERHALYFTGFAERNEPELFGTAWLGEYDTAARHLTAGLATSRELGAHWLVAWTLARLGLLAVERRDLTTAGAQLAESLGLCRDMGDRQGIARGLEGLGQLASVQGHPETAVRLVGAASTIRSAACVPLSAMERTRLEHVLAPANVTLGETASEAAWTAGQCLSLQEALWLAGTLTTGARS